jgi:PTH1 family peptidyl-tRNA hydrolase
VQTRHNIGASTVETFAHEAGIRVTKEGFSSYWSKGKIGEMDVIFLLPQTYMNRSGEAVREVLDYFKIGPDRMMVLHDDLDLALGRVKLDFNAGPAGHRGVASTSEELGTKAYHRIRMGIGRPTMKEQVESFVLSPFLPEEEVVVGKMIGEARECLKKWILEDCK